MNAHPPGDANGAGEAGSADGARAAGDTDCVRDAGAEAADPRPPGPRPTPPSPEQCCDRGCDPCIWTYHAWALERWQKRQDDWEAAQRRAD